MERAIYGIGGGIAMPTRLGNFPTEDLVTMLAEIATLLGIDPQSHRGNGATRKQVAELALTNPNMRYS